MTEFLAKVPFDIYELALFQLVVKEQSLTRAAERAGLTQSAVTRQVQGMEHALGVKLLERTTRSLKPTTAGRYLFRESSRLLGDVDQVLTHLNQEFAGAPKEVRVTVSRTISLASLPGFFHANLRRLPTVACRVASQSTAEIFASLEANEADLGVLCPPGRLPGSVRVTHRFREPFTLIAPATMDSQVTGLTTPMRKRQWLEAQRWLLIEEKSDTGPSLRKWLRQQELPIVPTAQLDNFDLIINLVSLGMGISCVPIRALALYNQRRMIIRVPFPKKFTRDLVVLVHKRREMPEHLSRFIENVLF